MKIRISLRSHVFNLCAFAVKVFPHITMKTFSFQSTVFRIQAKGGWTFVTLPDDFRNPDPGPWGRTPVTATLNGKTWETSIWTEKSGRTLLPLSKSVRGNLDEGDVVSIHLSFR